MILLHAGDKVGFSPRFPIFRPFRNNEYLTVVDWKKYVATARLFVLANFLLMALVAAFQLSTTRSNYSSAVDLLVIPFPAYVILRLYLLQKSATRIETPYAAVMTVAPRVVWADYISFGLLYIVLYEYRLTFDEGSGQLAFDRAMQIFFAAIGVLPLANYLAWKWRKTNC